MQGDAGIETDAGRSVLLIKTDLSGSFMVVAEVGPDTAGAGEVSWRHCDGNNWQVVLCTSDQGSAGYRAGQAVSPFAAAADDCVLR